MASLLKGQDSKLKKSVTVHSPPFEMESRIEFLSPQKYFWNFTAKQHCSIMLNNWRRWLQKSPEAQRSQTLCEKMFIYTCFKAKTFAVAAKSVREHPA